MIEEIKKQLINEIEDTYLNECESRDVCNLIRDFNFNLDNQPDYKSAWEELKKVIWKLVDDEKREDKFWAKRELKNNIDDSMQELESKYKLGGE